MSRLRSHRQKQFVRSMIILLVVFLVLSYIFFAIGLKLIIQGSLFVSNIFNNNQTTTTSTSSNFFGTVDLDAPPTATNSARIILTGQVSNFDQLDFFINGEKVKTVDVTDKTTFSQKVGDLQKESNTLYVRAQTNDEKEFKTSSKFTVIYKNDKPKLNISEPQDNSQTSKNEIPVVGTTDKDVSLTLNSRPLVVDYDGSFKNTVRLNEGENKLVFVATDIAGNQESKTITIKYQKED